jgi:MFS family permease
MGLYFSRDIDTTTVFMFVFGVASVGRATNSFLYMGEVVPERKRVLMATLLQVLVGCVPAIGSIYFTRISKNWLWLEIWAGGLTVLCLVATFFMPESPKYLMSKKRYNDARKALTYISKFNGKSTAFTNLFDKEVFEKE